MNEEYFAACITGQDANVVLHGIKDLIENGTSVLTYTGETEGEFVQ